MKWFIIISLYLVLCILVFILYYLACPEDKRRVIDQEIQDIRKYFEDLFKH